MSSGYSVALCTYNGERYIKEQLESILAQTIVPDEIIVSDDGSVDDTLKIVEDVLGSSSTVKYKIVKNTRGKGVANNFSNAISMCTQNIIFTSDQDDVWVSNKAETILRKFEDNKDALLVFTNGVIVDSNLNTLNLDMWTWVRLTEKKLAERKWFDYLIVGYIVTGATMAFKKELFESDEEIPSGWLHDDWLAWKACARKGLVPCEEKLILYRQHGDNVCGMDVSSMKRVNNFISNFKPRKSLDSKQYKRCLDINKYFGKYFSSAEQEELNHYTLFCKDLSDSENQSRIKRTYKVIKHTKNGDFKKYYHGLISAFREVVVSLFF